MSKSFVDLGLLPTLKKYLDRVGAEPKSFRRYAIVTEDQSGYQRETASITVKPDGTLKLWGEVAPPLKEEIPLIATEVAGAGWPTTENAPSGSLPPALKDADKESVFVFRTRDKKVRFVQHRVEMAGGKVYLPYSFWSDGQWRNIEPDGPLPLFGLDKIDGHTTVFVHEGAKPARYCQWLNTDTREAKAALAAHPWGNEISAVAHVGWAGGAPNPHRTDWKELRSAGVTAVYVVADNDDPGQQAVSEISRLTKQRMTAVLFDDRFKTGFDLADPWPSAKEQPGWWAGPRYLGPAFHEMCVPATWATRKADSEKPGRPAYELREDFYRQWALSKEPHLVAHRDFAHLVLTPEVFNRTVSPYSDTDDVARLLAKYVPCHADGITYTPHHPRVRERIITKDGRRLVNTYRPPIIRALRGNFSTFLRLMRHLFPNKRDRFLVMRWCATLIARPDIRMRYSLLLISETQGVGKTTLSDAILKPLVGPWNVSMPTEAQVTDTGFNSWRAHKRLAIVNEIYSGERRKCYDRLKGVTSDDYFEVNKKFIEPYMIENFLHIIACSNSIKAIHLDDEDRRFLVPAVAEKQLPKERWDKFYGWVNGGGLATIAYWAEVFVKKHGPVSTSEHAPETSRKREVIAGMRSEGAQIAYDLAEAVKAYPLPVVLRLDEVRHWVAKTRNMDTHSSKMESLLTLRKAMMAAGLQRPKRTDTWDGRITIGGRPTEVIANFPIESRLGWGTKPEAKDGLVEHYHAPDAFLTEKI